MVRTGEPLTVTGPVTPTVHRQRTAFRLDRTRRIVTTLVVEG
jgi:hypothetical protein